MEPGVAENWLWRRWLCTTLWSLLSIRSYTLSPCVSMSTWRRNKKRKKLNIRVWSEVDVHVVGLFDCLNGYSLSSFLHFLYSCLPSLFYCQYPFVTHKDLFPPSFFFLFALPFVLLCCIQGLLLSPSPLSLLLLKTEFCVEGQHNINTQTLRKVHKHQTHYTVYKISNRLPLLIIVSLSHTMT